ncbi:MAG: cohesin domain-containing protein [Candidatus Marinimicrobia bacterium]|nr:cohesin domain-containing protein [Candidatus Neomarinimicrobiota bacterium]
MKKQIFSLILGSLVFGVMTAFAATTVSLAPVNVAVEEGQEFNLAVSVNPQSVENYTVKLEIKYPADTLEVGSFAFGSGWMPLAQSGYDSIDNNNGVLIKTAGYPGGINSDVSFGTIVFKAKKSGNANIQVTGNSLALDANNLNVIGGLPVETSVAITPVVVSEEQTNLQEVVTPIIQPLSEENEITPVETQQQLSQVSVVPVLERYDPLLAAVGSLVTLGTGNNIVATAFVFALFAVAWIAYLMIDVYFVKKKKQVSK